MPPEELLGRLLGEPLVRAVDGYFDARGRLIAAIVAGDLDAAQQANADSRTALGTWLALLVERLDSRSASLLVDVLKRVEALEAEQGRLALRVTNLESLMGVSPGRPHDDPDDPTGFDAGRRL